MDIDDIYLAGKNAAYDSAAKKLLASRKILAWILKYCVEEFKESEIADIRDRYIIGTPEVALTPVLPVRRMRRAISVVKAQRMPR